ncbi:MAG: hypothetical protein RQ751_08305, partial [Longimicrobiales bacterium]|nr:hypothetical protein [Longimicrobiales bacterium]
VTLPPPEVRKIEVMSGDRESDLWFRVEADSVYNRIVTSTWRAILEGAPAPPSEEAARKAFEELLAAVRRDVAKVRERGGEVVFVRAPSSDWFRDFERQATPRQQVWEPIIGAGEAVGIHFEDYPELSNVRTPEWSHISAHDKSRWTRSLVAILRTRLTERGVTRPELGS